MVVYIHNANIHCNIFCTDSMRCIETTDKPSNTLGMFAFSVSMAIHMIFIFVTLIGRRYVMDDFDLLLSLQETKIYN